MTCAACETLSIDELFKRAEVAKQFELHSSFHLLDDAANNGCRTCQIFRKHFYETFHNFKDDLFELQQKRGIEPPIIVFLSTFLSKGRKRSITKLHVQIGDEVDKPGTEPLRITFRVCKPKTAVFQSKVENCAYTFRYNQIDHNLSSDENYRIARDWIEECCTRHKPAVCLPPTPVELPTRLIDVGEPPDFHMLHLVQPSEHEKGQYVALSHCWGPPGSKKLLTTAETLKSRMHFIDIKDMPPNFSDAVKITRKLGYRFLWIDSLCIIQDSKSDWETESEKMGRIYMNATLTIAAAAATSSEGGLLKESYQPISDEQLHPTKWFAEPHVGRTHSFLQHPVSKNDDLATKSEVSLDTDAYYMKLNRDDDFKSISLEPLTEFSGMEENWFRITSGGPLSHRGWCLQERLLSRRLLYYGNRQIYWQCTSSREAADGEDVPVLAARSQANLSNEVSEWPDILGLRELYRETFSTRSLDQRQALTAQIYQTWHNILFMYNNRSLTFDSDKLPGLAGIAALIHDLTGDQYVVGLWRSNLLLDLVWSQTNRILREDAPRSVAEPWELEMPEWEKETSEITGPSWSWCSQVSTGRLAFFADHNREHQSRIWQSQDAEILDVKVDIVSDKSFGQVLSGQLVMRGFTYPRWDVRTLEGSEFQRKWAIWSSIILSVCPHSPWIRNRGNTTSSDRNTLWDYWPRQTTSRLMRVWIHILWWLVDLCRIALWQGMVDFYRKRDRVDCGACNQYLCLHMLSVADKTPRRDSRHEVELFSLVLEPVPGETEKYRRIGLSRKLAYITEQEFLNSTLSGDSSVASEAFDGWQFREVVIM